ncbi:hypothetical protein NEMBOFW57_005240 [Staphylotrichum longicolle]|uniref:Uncharacterized protein n=1 Tax=Staphylotrichum longicolle TaxID=669026 RepID=A0AAD4EWZ0_9PEZI|nr:hypothetical protein NEMBOFW57_005240 [Staphylotrichum longicolle]
MPVTEFALLHLSQTGPAPAAPPLPAAVRETLASAMQLQSAWHAAHFPSLPSRAADRAAVWFAQVEDPAVLLTTARWASVAAHWDWIRSADNVAVMAALAERGDIIAEDTVLWHVEGEIFGGGGGEEEGGGTRGRSGGDGPAREGVVPLLQSPVISVGRMFVAREKREAFAAKFEEVKGILEEYARPHLVREIRGILERVDLKHYKPLSLE